MSKWVRYRVQPNVGNHHFKSGPRSRGAAGVTQRSHLESKRQAGSRRQEKNRSELPLHSTVAVADIHDRDGPSKISENFQVIRYPQNNSDSDSSSPIPKRESRRRYKYLTKAKTKATHGRRNQDGSVFETPVPSSYNNSSYDSTNYLSGDDGWGIKSEPAYKSANTGTGSRRLKEKLHLREKSRSNCSRARPRVTYQIMERSSKSLADSRHKTHRRRRRRSIEISLYEPTLPPNEPRIRPCTPRPKCVKMVPCHTDWNQAYEPEYCASRESSCETVVDQSRCIKNTTTYCPETLIFSKRNSGESNSSILKKLSRGYKEDKALRTQVIIKEKHRNGSEGRHKVVTMNSDNRNPRSEVEMNDIDDDVRFGNDESKKEAKKLEQFRFDLVESKNGAGVKQLPHIVRHSQSFSEIPRNYDAFPIQNNPVKHSKNERYQNLRAEHGLDNSVTGLNSHSFPFTQTVSGNLKVKTEQVTFENKKVAVLISDPRDIQVNVRQDSVNPNPDTKWDPPKRDPKPKAPPAIPSLPDYDSAADTNSQHRNEIRRNASSGPSGSDREAKFKTRDDANVPVMDSGSDSETDTRVRSVLKVDRMAQTSDVESDRRSISGIDHLYAKHFENCGGTKEFMRNIHYRLKRAMNPDTNIIVGGKGFPCHAIALQCYSKYFDKKHRSSEQIMEVEIPERIISANEFRNLMDWILIGESDKKLVISKENVVGLFSGSVYLDMPALREDCLEFVRLKLEEEDPFILKLYEQAGQKDNIQTLVSLLSTKLSALFPKLYKSKQFLQMNVKELVTLLKSDTIKIKSELDVYDAAARWLLFDWNARQNHTVEIMETVRFGLLSPLQLTQIRHSADAGSMPEYANIYSYGEVKKFLEDGLSYAIFRENYTNRPGELNRWIIISEVRPPNPRYNMDDEPDLNRMPAHISFQYDHDQEQTPKISARKTSEAEEFFKKYRKEQENEDIRKHQNYMRHDTHDEDKYSTQIQNQYGKEQSIRHVEDYHRGSVDIDEEDSMSTFLKDRRKKSLVHEANNNVEEEEVNLEEVIVIGEEDQPVTLTRRQIRVRAVVLIQAKVRAWLARRWFKRVRYAVIRIQIWYRAHRLLMHARKNYKPLDPPRGTKHLTQPKHSILNARPVENLILDDSPAFIVFGGHDPTQDINKNNSADEILQLDVSKNIWTLKGHLPEPRVHSGAVRNGSVIILFGGADPRFRNSRDKLVPTPLTFCLDVETGRWRKLADMQTGRRNFGYATSNGKIFAFGGVDEDGKTLSSCESYDPDYNMWSYIQSMDGPRTCMGVVKHDGQIWIAGGMAKYQSYPILKSVITYNVRQNRFYPAPSLPHAVCNPTMASYQGQLFMIGGAGKAKGADKAHSLSTILSFMGGEWKVLTQLTTARHGHCQLNAGRYITILGGISSLQMKALDTVETFNMEKYTTRTRVAPMPKRLTGLCGVVLH